MIKLDNTADIIFHGKRIGKILFEDRILYSHGPTLPVITTWQVLEEGDRFVEVEYGFTPGSGTLLDVGVAVNGGGYTLIDNPGTAGVYKESNLENGQPIELRLRIRYQADVNTVTTVISDPVTATPESGTLFTENFSDVTSVTDDPWRQDNGNAIAGGNVTIREEGGEKHVQIKHIAFNETDGIFRGTRRLEHPFSYFNLGDRVPAATFQYDLYFETIWDFNTVARDRNALFTRLTTYKLPPFGSLSSTSALPATGSSGRGFIISGNLWLWSVVSAQWVNLGAYSNGFPFTAQQANDYIDSTWNDVDGTPYTATGFPYQTGKLHGLVSEIAPDEFGNPRPGPSGRQAPSPKEWSVRISWTKDVVSHPTLVDGVYTEGADPAVGPAAAIYYYGQDRISGEVGKRIIMPTFRFEKNRHYTVVLHVQVNDPGAANGVLTLSIYDKTTEDLLGSVTADNILLHDTPEAEDAYIHRLFFSTFFGGGNMRYGPKLDPAWDELVDVSNGVYMRNDNYLVLRRDVLQPVYVEDIDFDGQDATLYFTYPDIDQVQVNMDDGDYNPQGWTNIAHSGTGVKQVTVPAAEADGIRLRVIRDGRTSKLMFPVIVPPLVVVTEPAINVFTATHGNELVTLNWAINPGSDPVTSIDYRYKEQGGEYPVLNDGWTPVTTLANNGSQVVPGTNGQAYVYQIRATSIAGTTTSVERPATPSTFAVFTAFTLTPGVNRIYGDYTINEGGNAITELAYRYRPVGGVFTSWIGLALVASGEFEVDGDLVNGQAYEVQARTRNVNPRTVLDEYSRGAGIEIPAGQPIIDTFVATGIDKAIRLIWSINSQGSPITLIEYSIDGGAPIDTGSVLESDTFDFPTPPTLTNGQSYSTKILVTNGVGVVESVIRSATPSGLPIVTTQVTGGVGQFTLNYTTASNGNTITTRRWRYRQSGGEWGAWITLANASGSVVQVVANGFTYEAQVEASNIWGSTIVGDSDSVGAPPVIEQFYVAEALPEALKVYVKIETQNTPIDYFEIQVSTEVHPRIFSSPYVTDGFITLGNLQAEVLTGLTLIVTTIKDGAYADTEGTPVVPENAPVLSEQSVGDGFATVTWQYRPGIPDYSIEGIINGVQITVNSVDTGNLTITDWEYNINDTGWLPKGAANYTFDIITGENSVGVEQFVKIRAINSFGEGVESVLKSAIPIGVNNYEPVHGNTFTWNGFEYTVIVKEYAGGITLACVDRNLGASRVPIANNDNQGYGDLYQWGRLTDGHEKRNSGSQTAQSSANTPGHGNFIMASDWRNPKNDNLWQGEEGINNPCPPGWRLPTVVELQLEYNSWGSANSVGAFSSNLKWALSGRRLNSDGEISNTEERIYIWTSTVNADNSEAIRVLPDGVAANTTNRGIGGSVRAMALISGGNPDPDPDPEPDPEPTVLSTNPNDWEQHGMVYDAGSYLVAGLVDLNGNTAAMLLQRGGVNRGVDSDGKGIFSNCGWLLYSNDLINWSNVGPGGTVSNPVLIEAMPWAGQETTNGGIQVPHRVAPRTLIKWNGTYYTYTRDRLGTYTGKRGVGVFSSNDLINWTGYNSWFLSVDLVAPKVPSASPSYYSRYDEVNEVWVDVDPVFGTARCYLKCATVGPDNKIYIIVEVSSDGIEDGATKSFMFRGTNPLDFSTFEWIQTPWHWDQGFAGAMDVENIYYVNDRWIWIGRGDGSFNTIALKEMPDFDSGAYVRRDQGGTVRFETDQGGFNITSGPRETIFPFFFKGKWHLLYDRNATSNIYLASMK